MYRVLIVDDDKAVLETLNMLFKVRHFDVTTATSGADAIAVLAKDSFDLVVTDMRMETETAGFDVVHRAASHSIKPFIVILSAYPIPTSEWRAAGADAMYSKGGGAFRIIDNLERQLESRSRTLPVT